MAKAFYMGLDIGQAQDFTAKAIVHLVEPKDPAKTRFRLRYLQRPALGTPYPTIVDDVTKQVRGTTLNEDVDLVVDATGVGRPIVDMFRKRGLSPFAVTITGGDKETQDDWTFRVPKRNLVMQTNLLLQSGRLEFSTQMEHVDVFVKEMQNFKVKVDPLTAHDSYEAARSGEHDDLVLAVALACWRASKMVPNLFRVPKPLPKPEQWEKVYTAKLAKKLQRQRRPA